MRIQNNGIGIPQSSGSKEIADLPSASQITAGKVEQVVQLLSEAKEINTNWNDYYPEEQAELVVNLEDRAAPLLDGKDASANRVRNAVQDLHFLYVFPIVGELNPKSAEDSFAKTVHHIAQEVWKKESVEPMNGLNDIQKSAVLEFARRARG